MKVSAPQKHYMVFELSEWGKPTGKDVVVSAKNLSDSYAQADKIVKYTWSEAQPVKPMEYWLEARQRLLEDDPDTGPRSTGWRMIR